MSMYMSITERLMHSTIRVECNLKDGGTSTGTGFLFEFLEDGEYGIPAIVTNKHVVRGAVSGGFIFTLRDNEDNPINNKHQKFYFIDFENRWIMHPDPDVDLCIMLISDIIESANRSNIKLYYTTFGKSLIPTKQELEQLTAMEDIIMIGYPNGIWDSVNNSPILRKGITATHPNLDYEGREEFMIDAACFPGSSGSPVLLLNIGGYTSKYGTVYTGVDRMKLLGVLYAGPQHTATGEIKIKNIPTRQEPISVSRIPNNLGIIIKASKLLDFEPILEKLMTQGSV